jgi:hypothetical protein
VPRSTFCFCLLLALVGSFFGAADIRALEADPYWGAERELEDAGPALNAFMNVTIDEVLAESHGLSCRQVSRRIMRKFHFFIFHELELWPLNSALVDRIPAHREEHGRYRRNMLYHNHGPLDTGMWMPWVDVMEIDGVRLGTDKLSHFASSGWRFRNKYLREIKHGRTPEEAERRIIRKSILGERTAMGALTTGVLSPGDLEANYQGMRFYLSLCEGSDPLLIQEGSAWILREPVDISGYVSPEWDESYQIPSFSGFRWRKVKPVIERYCFLLDNPVFLDRMASYRERESETMTEKILGELGIVGWGPEGSPYSLAANCPTSETPRTEAQPQDQQDAAQQAPRDWEEEVQAELADKALRSFGLLGVQLGYPKGPAASLALFLSRVPRTLDCPSACELNGLFLQLEPGLKGGQISAGWARVYGARHWDTLVLSQVYIAIGGKISLFRPWGSIPSGVAHQTHLGVEGEFTIAQVNFTLGAFRPVSPHDSSQDWLFSAGLGWGF